MVLDYFITKLLKVFRRFNAVLEVLGPYKLDKASKGNGKNCIFFSKGIKNKADLFNEIIVFIHH